MQLSRHLENVGVAMGGKCISLPCYHTVNSRFIAKVFPCSHFYQVTASIQLLQGNTLSISVS